ncbi:MAG: AFG1/ZapE family ATPase [Aliidongia sp.]
MPLLKPELRNEAKRFNTLIDTFYEAKVHVVISAAAAPEALYPEGDGSFEFQRTVSRPDGNAVDRLYFGPASSGSAAMRIRAGSGACGPLDVSR